MNWWGRGIKRNRKNSVRRKMDFILKYWNNASTSHQTPERMSLLGNNDTHWTGPLLESAQRYQTRCWSEPRLPRTGETGCRGWERLMKAANKTVSSCVPSRKVCRRVISAIWALEHIHTATTPFRYGPGWIMLWNLCNECRYTTRFDKRDTVRCKQSHKLPAYLSSLSRQWTNIGRIPDLMRSSMGGLRSLDSSFLWRPKGNKRKVE